MLLVGVPLDSVSLPATIWVLSFRRSSIGNHRWRWQIKTLTYGWILREIRSFFLYYKLAIWLRLQWSLLGWKWFITCFHIQMFHMFDLLPCGKIFTTLEQAWLKSLIKCFMRRDFLRRLCINPFDLHDAAKFLSNFADMGTYTYIQPDTASVQAFFSSQLKAFAIDIFFRKSWQLSFYCTQATYLACMLMCVCLYLFAKVFLQFHVPSHIMITRRARERERRTHDKYVFRDKGKRSTFRNYFTLERTRKLSFQIPVIT